MINVKYWIILKIIIKDNNIMIKFNIKKNNIYELCDEIK
jgi:hypothetical protein